MHNIFNESAEHGKFFRQFPSLLDSTSQLILNDGSYPRSDTENQRESPTIPYCNKIKASVNIFNFVLRLEV